MKPWSKTILESKELCEECRKCAGNINFTTLQQRMDEVDRVADSPGKWVSEEIRINYLKSIISGKIHIGS